MLSCAVCPEGGPDYLVPFVTLGLSTEVKSRQVLNPAFSLALRRSWRVLLPSSGSVHRVHAAALPLYLMSLSHVSVFHP